MLLFSEVNSRVLEELQIVQVNYHVFFQLLSQLLDLCFLVRIGLNFVVVFEVEVKLGHLLPVLVDGGFEILNSVRLLNDISGLWQPLILLKLFLRVALLKHVPRQKTL